MLFEYELSHDFFKSEIKVFILVIVKYIETFEMSIGRLCNKLNSKFSSNLTFLSYIPYNVVVFYTFF